MLSDHPFLADCATQHHTFHPLNARKFDDVIKRHHKHIEERVNTTSFNLTGSKLYNKKFLRKVLEMCGTEAGGKRAEISILLPSIAAKLDTSLNFDLTGRYVDMRLDRRNCNLGNDSISDNIHRPSRILGCL